MLCLPLAPKKRRTSGGETAQAEELELELGEQQEADMQAEESVAGLGPSSKAQLWCWHKDILNNIEIHSEESAQRLKTNLSHGLLFGEDFAGMRTAAEGLHMVVDAYQQKHPCVMPLDTVQHLYTCDNGRAPQKLCLQGSKPAMHRFNDMTDRVSMEPNDMMDMWEEEAPPIDMKGTKADNKEVLVKREKIYAAMGKYLMMSQEKELCGGLVRSSCLRHPDMTCSLCPAGLMQHRIFLVVAGSVCPWPKVGDRARDHACLSTRGPHRCVCCART
mmetsp:Transcript_154422/g.474618  ORF Transcript_154422/g.474618 Transcript_154422/m.474618 type:complete len:274 (+) Transcript_154422:49-870(+)